MEVVILVIEGRSTEAVWTYTGPHADVHVPLKSGEEAVHDVRVHVVDSVFDSVQCRIDRHRQRPSR